MSVTSVASSFVRWSPQTSQSPQFISLATDAPASPSPASVSRFKRSQSYQKAYPCGWTKKKREVSRGEGGRSGCRGQTQPLLLDWVSRLIRGMSMAGKKKTQSIFWEGSTKHINPSPGLVLHVDVQAHSRLLRFSSRTKLSHDKAQLSRPVPDNSATSPVHCQTEERHTFSASSRFFLSHFWHFQSLSLSLHVLPAPAPPRSPLPLHLSICVKFLKLNSCSCLLSLCRLSAKASVITPVCDWEKGLDKDLIFFLPCHKRGHNELCAPPPTQCSLAHSSVPSCGPLEEDVDNGRG